MKPGRDDSVEPAADAPACAEGETAVAAGRAQAGCHGAEATSQRKIVTGCYTATRARLLGCVSEGMV